MRNDSFLIIIAVLLILNRILLNAAYIPININKEKYPELAKFIEKYHCPKSIQQNKDQHFFKKNEYDRIINAERMKNVIQKYKLDQLDVTNKYLCEKDGSFHVLSENVSKATKADNKLSLTQVKQLFTLARETGFRDWDTDNIVFNKNEKLTFIDTEDMSFSSDVTTQKVKKIKLPENCKSNFVVSLLDYFSLMEIPSEAHSWFKKASQDLLETQEGRVKTPTLPNNPAYDDPDVDIAKVKQELLRLN